ncbi:hypothetical protein Pla52o_37180 [Novipirellula galeiformis]|uniref:Uncharacterized protein n=1 Tax=Novipirellula galeiformis TaxID=2528004 RepID=A0A5C6CDN3_9BACT|nr:hypothetical protein Pla52o_37180 [Novipirellula galeiformis]
MGKDLIWSEWIAKLDRQAKFPPRRGGGVGRSVFKLALGGHDTISSTFMLPRSPSSRHVIETKAFP